MCVIMPRRPRARVTSCYEEPQFGIYKVDRYFIHLDYQCAYIIIQDYGNSEFAQELRSNTAGEFIYGPLHACHPSTWHKLVSMITVLLDIPSINLHFDTEYEPYDYYFGMDSDYD